MAPRSRPRTRLFIEKLAKMVSSEELTDIRWCNDGCSFHIEDPKLFAENVLPNYFRHNKFSSFVRQLNIYGFHKCHPLKWEFNHSLFRRDSPELLCRIVRNDPKQTSGHGKPRQAATKLVKQEMQVKQRHLKEMNATLSSQLEKARQEKHDLEIAYNGVVQGLSMTLASGLSSSSSATTEDQVISDVSEGFMNDWPTDSSWIDGLINLVDVPLSRNSSTGTEGIFIEDRDQHANAMQFLDAVSMGMN